VAQVFGGGDFRHRLSIPDQESKKEVLVMTEEAGKATGTVAGEMTIQEQVVAKIAGGAAREVEGVYAMGTGSFAEAVTGVATAIAGEDVKKGVRVEVGKKEAAVDVWLTVEYGFNIPKVVQGVREKITERVYEMTALKVVEINAQVVDIHLPGEEPERRVE
jgi:uncharacterized alkaline shock family protein YloU